ncbi:GNAT family N-acetyltransferase [Saccharopolyspora hirsuta]|uniref:GNAT family N-acetyltransferase n=1 Tax=Saccharopolyspora hirsuta TaxID=1837 RepID=A0A5M7C3Y0_SACHI|nr:GNAT family N-acetyltransferase [Saccharopolyspora hirsuta]KAA5837096.1 GNAT family N-acetyltransferase [Saccharopolyspora hirsuta]
MEFEVDDARDRVDRDVVWDFLATQAYWGKWRRREHLDQQIDQAWRVVGAYRKSDGGLIGFARAFSDGVGSAYLADVFVLPEARGHGVGKALVRVMIEDGPGRDFRWMLHTDDAHGLCRSFGFAEPDTTYMERPRPTS